MAATLYGEIGDLFDQSDRLLQRVGTGIDEIVFDCQFSRHTVGETDLVPLTVRPDMDAASRIITVLPDRSGEPR